MKRSSAFLILALCASPALADAYFQVDTGRWQVFGTGEKCFALNRPAAEFNFAPFNALQIRMDSTRQPEVNIMFWPEVVPATTDKIALAITPDDAVLLKASLTMGDIGMVTVAEPLPKDFLRRLESGAQLTTLEAEVPGSKARTAFDISDLPKVMMHLQTCVGVLERSKKGE